MPTNYYRRVVLGQRKEPYIAVRTPEDSKGPIKLSAWSLTDAIPSWDFPGHDGETVEVEVYSAGDEVELFLNGVSCGRAPASGKRPCEAVFRIPYAVGELKAVSLISGQPVSEYSLKSSGNAVTFEVVQEDDLQRKELEFIRIQAVNECGEPVYASIPDLTISLEGDAAQMLAFGSLEALHHGGYQNPVLGVRNGKALLILRRKSHGQMKLMVSAAGMQSTEAMLNL